MPTAVADEKEQAEARDGFTLSDSSPDEEQAKDEADESQEKPQEQKEEGGKSQEQAQEGEKGEEGEEKAKGQENLRQAPVPYERFAKVVAERNELEDKYDELQAKVEKYDAFAKEVGPALEFVKNLIAARNFDPKIRELFQDHWLFTGRDPQDSDIDNLKAYGEFLAEQKRSDTSAVASTGEEETEEADSEAVLKRWEEEEKKISSDKDLATLATPERIDETYREIQRRGLRGEDIASLSFEKVFRDLWFSDILEAKKEAGRKEAAAKAVRKKPASMKPGRAIVSEGTPDFSKMTLQEHIRHVIGAA